MAERRGTKALELWCRRMTDGYPGVKIDNMTTSWRDGLAFCAMIHHFRPDLIDFEKLNKADVYYNNELAFTTAEKYLGIPALLDAEDMASYEVPDRLSILTYLSQFYQVFAAQDSHNRLKRTSPAVDTKTQITKTPGPPPKMAHVVGVPRRDPCQKCKLPVFLAERLTVGKKVFHRTCLKCARCKSQLSPGSFYETEVDDEFCCETCPDEEHEVQGAAAVAAAAPISSVQLRIEEPGESMVSRPKTVRSSIADRLAFFEQSKASTGLAVSPISTDTKLLQKSVSDEEKTKSLKKMEAITPYKLNSALSSFLNDTIDSGASTTAATADVNDDDDGEDSEATSSAADSTSHTNSDRKTNMETSDSDQEEHVEELSLEPQAPQLPQTPAPQIAKASEPKPQQSLGQKFTTTAQMNLTTNWAENVSLKIIEDDDNTVKAQDILTSYNMQKSEIEEKPRVAAAAEITTRTSEIKLKLSTKTIETTTTAAATTTTTIDSLNNNAFKEVTSNEEITQNKTAPIAKTNAIIDDVDDEDVDNNDGDDDVKVELTPSFVEPNHNVNVVTKEASVEAKDATQTSLDEVASNVKTQEGDMKMEIDAPNVSTATERVTAEVELRNKTTMKLTEHHSPVKEAITLSPQHEDVETTKRLSVVRARLHQFEVIANNNDNQELGTNKEKEKEKEKEKDRENKEMNTLRSSFKDKKEVNKASAEDQIKIEEAEVVKEAKVTEAITATNLIYVETKENLNQVPEIIENIEQEEKETKQQEIEQEKPKKQGEEEQQKNQEEILQIVEENSVVLQTSDDNKKPLELSVNERDEPTPMDLEVDVAEYNKSEVEAEPNDIPATIEELSTTQPTPLPAATIATIPAQPSPTQSQTLHRTTLEKYPVNLNPFGSDDDDDENTKSAEVSGQADENKENTHHALLRTPAPRSHTSIITQTTPEKESLNPFDSSDDEIELEKSTVSVSSPTTTPTHKVPPPRPPPPRLSRNPFGEDASGVNSIDEDGHFSRRSSLTSSLTRKTPVPTPRTNLSQSQNPTPEPTPRLSNKTHSYNASPALHDSASDYYGSANSLTHTPHVFHRNSELRGSNNSLASSAGGTIRSRKQRRAPLPPSQPTVKELFPSPIASGTDGRESVGHSQPSTPSSSTKSSPKQSRKKRPAPAPPKPARLDTSQVLPNIEVQVDTPPTQPKNSFSYPLQSELDSKLSDEEKALLEGNLQKHQPVELDAEERSEYASLTSQRSSRRLIPLDASLLLDEDGGGGGGGGSPSSKCDDLKHKEHKEHEEELNVVYRRVLVAPLLETPTHDGNPLIEELNESHDRQLEKLKDNKEAKNRNRQSQISIASSGGEDSDPLYNKSSHGKWKRRKGPAPALPIPPRKVLQMLPLQEIKHELDIIEVQQQGLEKQGVVLEKMIRDRCEGENGEPLNAGGIVAGDASDGRTSVTENSKEVEDLILQLFELVNEKNELFRRQAELMYLRRQHRLEQEQADIEYEIRVLMAQPERNKTDSDKAREEALIARLVEIVQLRNEVVECLEMDRLREAEEDMSIKKRLEWHTAQREGDESHLKVKSIKLSKKEKKKQKETKKLEKSKKLDVDKDADESELNGDKQKAKKKKKKLFF